MREFLGEKHFEISSVVARARFDESIQTENRLLGTFGAHCGDCVAMPNCASLIYLIDDDFLACQSFQNITQNLASDSKIFVAIFHVTKFYLVIYS